MYILNTYGTMTAKIVTLDSRSYCKIRLPRPKEQIHSKEDQRVQEILYV